MKVILYMAMSVNGMIAGEHGEEDFLSSYNWDALCRLAKEHGNFIWGRKTYEIVSKWDPKHFTDDIKRAEKIVVSTDSNLSLVEGYIHAYSPKEALATLQSDGFETAILTGGSGMNSAFAEQDLIDEVLINIEGVMIGNGIPLFAAKDFKLDLKLVSIEHFGESGVTLRYEVMK